MSEGGPEVEIEINIKAPPNCLVTFLFDKSGIAFLLFHLLNRLEDIIRHIHVFVISLARILCRNLMGLVQQVQEYTEKLVSFT